MPYWCSAGLATCCHEDFQSLVCSADPGTFLVFREEALAVVVVVIVVDEFETRRR
jgi:hypothetical protein